MAAESVGQIGLDLVVNQGEFKKQMVGVQGMAKKAGLALAAALSVKKLVNFGKQCLELGSDLQEVQNVVDVTFPHMSKQVDNFAKQAITSFGLSETMAKEFTGTSGAMAKAFGFSEKAAYEMATTLTGLAGDVASFYNISQDEAYTKLKSVFTGETESLKDLGVVMTQTALDSYALTNGFGKTTAQMSEMEKVSLRYKFVQDQLSAASGDFIRTADGWANQVRVLKLQFDSLKATIGQGLINVLTPVIKVINTIIGKLMSLANAFKAFTEMITGKGSSGGGANAAAASMETVAETSKEAGKAIGGAGSAAKKAKGQLSDMDKLHVLSTSDGDSGGGAGASGGYNVDQFDMGEMDTSAVEETENRYQGLIDRVKELAGLVKAGFWDGFGDTAVFDNIQASIAHIKKSLEDIFTAPEVQKAARQFANTFAYNLGKVAGSIAKIGVSIAANLTGGIAKYLQNSSGRIKQYLVDMFDISSDITSIIGNFSAAFAEIFSVIADENGQTFTANFIGLFVNAGMAVTEFFGKLGRDILNLLLTPFTDNVDGFKEAFDGILGIAAQAMGDIKDIFTDTFDTVNQVYDEHIAPMFQAFTDGLTQIYNTVLEAVNTYILPAVQTVANKFTEFKDSHLQPLLDKFIEFGGKIADTITTVWNNALLPFFDWAVETFSPIIGQAIETLGESFFGFMDVVSEVADYILDALGGVLDFIQGAFTGDTETALNGLKDIFKGVFNAIVSIVENAVNFIVEGLNGISFDIPDAIPGFLGGGKHVGFDIEPVKLPRLAQGGFVRANTPRLAMIGDNRHYGEIVAPEDKMQELLDRAVNAKNGSSMDLMEIIMLLRDMVQLLTALNQKGNGDPLTMDDLFQMIRSENQKYKKQHNGDSAFI